MNQDAIFTTKLKNKFYDLAYKEALKAYKKKEVPVGAILVQNNKVIAKAHNLRERKKSPLAHAEALCIIKASKKLKTWKLDNLTLYVTLEPCQMCTSLIIQSRISNVIFLTKEPRNGSIISNLKLLDYNHTQKIKYTYDYVYECECLLKVFFKSIRNKT